MTDQEAIRELEVLMNKPFMGPFVLMATRVAGMTWLPIPARDLLLDSIDEYLDG